MITLTGLALATLLRPYAAQDAAVTLERKFVKGETRKYQVRSHLTIETDETGSPVAIPEEVSFEYDFTSKVTDVMQSGFAAIDYRRPALVQIDGETFDAPPRSHALTSNEHIALTLSPINEVTEMKTVSGTHATLMFRREEPTTLLQALPFSTSLYQMAVMIGGPDSSIDFNPKLPFEPVAPGATWKRTVSYTPQSLKGNASGKQAVQRVDMTYTYVGRKTVGGATVVRIEGALNLDTDVTRFVADSMGLPMDRSPVKSLKVVLHGKILFDLSPADLHTIRASATSNGDYLLMVQRGNQMLQVHQKITGTNKLKSV